MRRLLTRGKKRSRKTRNVIMGLLVGAACIYAVTYFLEIPTDQLLDFFLGSLLFVFGIIGLSILAIVVIKGLSRLFNK